MPQDEEDNEEIEVTPAMVEAGVDAFSESDLEQVGLTPVLTRVYRAMAKAAARKERSRA